MYNHSRTANAVGRTAAGLLLVVTGCGSPPAVDDLPGRLAEMADLGEPIQFSSTGEPIDAPGGPADPASLTMEAAVERALRHSPEVQAAAARVRVALADARQTRLLPNPVLGVVLRFPETGGKPEIEAGLTQELLSLVQRPRQAGAADARLRASASQVLTVALDVITDTHQAYLSLQTVDAELRTLADRLVLIERLLKITDARVNAGEAARLDLLVLSAQRAELKAQAVEKEAEQADQQLVLSRLIGQPSAAAIGPLAPWSPVQIPGTEHQWIRAALQHRPELQAQQWELAALGDESALARFAFFQGSAGVAAERDENWAVGPALDVPIPVFDWGQQRNERAAGMVVAARHELTRAKRQVVEDVRRAWAAYVAADRMNRLIDTEVSPLQEQRRAQAEAQYRNGAADISALLLAEQDALDSRLKSVQARNKTALAYVRLVRAIGGKSAVPTIQPAPASPPAPATQSGIK